MTIKKCGLLNQRACAFAFVHDSNIADSDVDIPPSPAGTRKVPEGRKPEGLKYKIDGQCTNQ